MQQTIHKQPIPLFDGKSSWILKLPRGSRVVRLSQQYPHDPTPFIWYLFDKDAPLADYRIEALGTGPMGETGNMEFLGTEIFHGGGLVIHFFGKWV